MVLEQISQAKINPQWAFSDKTRKETNYITHGYHKYPAKFIPHVASKLILEYTKEGDLVVDVFGGCGTTLIESKVFNRSSIAIDINPIAVLITEVKKTQINPMKLNDGILKIREKISLYNTSLAINTPKHERIDYWFKDEQKKKLSFLLNEINRVEDMEIRKFFYCGFSNILKNCSIWLQKSNKPMRDFNKIPSDPFIVFLKHIKSMAKGNSDFYYLLQKKRCHTTHYVYKKDARETGIKSNSVDLIITSPPYVTSYQYADLHQLTALWFKYTQNLNSFREEFIGRLSKKENNINLDSQFANEIHNLFIESKNKKMAEDVSLYFFEMCEVFKEMKRILKKGGHACIVIGDTKLKGVEIKNSHVFIEQCQKLGFKLDRVIKREIPSKNLPSVRDKASGKFTRISNKKKILSYPTEFILVFQK